MYLNYSKLWHPSSEILNNISKIYFVYYLLIYLISNELES